MNTTSNTFIYNALFAISSHYDDLKHLESAIFDVMDEIDSCIVTGFNEQTLNNYLNSGMSASIVDELRNFRNYVTKIDNKYWNSIDFDISDDWSLARKWARSLMQKLGWKRNGWDFGNSTIIYV